MRVIAQLANHLIEAGYDTIIATSAQLPTGLKINDKIQIAPYHSIKLMPEDRLVIPEGWPNALAPGLSAKCSCCLFVQNWSYLHGHLPQGIYWFNLPVKMLAISYPVAFFIKKTTGLTAAIIGPALDPNVFHANQDNNFCENGNEKIRIAWMPRKNKGLARQVFDILKSMLSMRGIPLPDLIEINNLEHAQVGNVMRSCKIFFASGFPEGFGLPPLEAMATSCIVAGFTGFGGWDYMRQIEGANFMPAFSMPDVPWGPNGIYVADGDVFGAASAIMKAMHIILQDDELHATLLHNGEQTAKWYSAERQKASLLKIWSDEKFWKNP